MTHENIDPSYLIDSDIAKLAFCDVVKAIDDFNMNVREWGLNCKVQYPESIAVNDRMYVFCDVCDVVSKATQIVAQESKISDS